MKITTVVILYCLLAVCSAGPVAKTQWHVRAPARGCVQLLFTSGGSQFRSYACDGVNGESLYFGYMHGHYDCRMIHKIIVHSCKIMTVITEHDSSYGDMIVEIARLLMAC